MIVKHFTTTIIFLIQEGWLDKLSAYMTEILLTNA